MIQAAHIRRKSDTVIPLGVGVIRIHISLPRIRRPARTCPHRRTPGRPSASRATPATRPSERLPQRLQGRVPSWRSGSTAWSGNQSPAPGPRAAAGGRRACTGASPSKGRITVNFQQYGCFRHPGPGPATVRRSVGPYACSPEEQRGQRRQPVCAAPAIVPGKVHHKPHVFTPNKRAATTMIGLPARPGDSERYNARWWYRRWLYGHFTWSCRRFHPPRYHPVWSSTHSL